MGAISGDVNSASIHCVDAADLTSRPVAALKSGDRAWITSKVGTAEGPLFYYQSDSAIATDGVGVIATSSGVGRWLSEALYPVGSGDLTVFTELAADTLVGAAPNANFFNSAALVAPADGFVDIWVTASLDSGANSANVAFAGSIQPAATNIGGFSVGTAGVSTVSSGGMVKRVAVTAGQSVSVRIATTPSADGADINAATLPDSQGLQILMKFSRS